METKKMLYVQSALEMVLDRVEEDERLLSSLSLFCIENGDESAVKEAVRDVIGEKCLDLNEEYSVRIYYVDANAVPLRVASHIQLLRGMDIPQWTMERLPLKYGTFALFIKPKLFSENNDKANKLQIFMMR